jgi:hypothetical protein
MATTLTAIIAAAIARNAPITIAASTVFMVSMLVSSRASVVSLVNRLFLCPMH